MSSWITDVFAYFIGSKFGKHKLAQDVSPKKSVEGAIAGLVFCALFFVGYGCFWWVKLKGTVIGLTLIPVLFYTYNGAFGKSPDFVNIAIFFISAAVVYVLETRMLSRDGECVVISERICFTALCLISVLFVIFTFYPLQIPLFRDPITGAIGISS